MAMQFDPSNPYEDPRGPGYPTPQAPAPAPSAPSGPTSDNYLTLIDFLNAYGPPSVDSYAAAINAAITQGLLPNGTSVNGDGSITLPSGEQMQVIDGRHWSYKPWTGSAQPTTPAPTGSVPGGDQGRYYDGYDSDWASAFEIDPSFLQPFPGKPPSRGLPSFVAPSQFEAPTKETILKDPGYLFREDRLKGSIENAAAARGTLNSGGTLDDIMSNVGSFASQEYDNAWNRAFSLWNQNWANSLSRFRADFDVSNADWDRLFNSYLQEKDTFFQNQERPFSKLATAARIGLDAARG